MPEAGLRQSLPPDVPFLFRRTRRRELDQLGGDRGRTTVGRYEGSRVKCFGDGCLGAVCRESKVPGPFFHIGDDLGEASVRLA